MTRVPISTVAEVNPPVEPAEELTPDQVVSFLPMAAVSEDGEVLRPQERSVADVRTGYTGFMRGDILVAKITPCFENGKAAHLTELPHEYGFGSTEFHVLRPRRGVHGRYVFHLLRSPAFRFIGAQHMPGSAGQKRLPEGVFERVRIPLPTLDVQRRIASVLDEACDLMRQVQSRASETEQLLPSVFEAMFGDPVVNPMRWESRPLRDSIAEIRPGWSAQAMDRPAAPGEWGVLKISAVTSGRFRPEENKALEGVRLAKPPVIPKQGDLLLSRANTRELVAAVCIVEHSPERLFLPDKLWLLLPKAGVATAEWLRYLLGHPGFRAAVAVNATGTSGSMLNISQEKFLAKLAPVPPIELQSAFSRHYWTVAHLRRSAEGAKAETEALVRGLLDRAFAGSFDRGGAI